MSSGRRTALVTGASRGIGRVVARRLAGAEFDVLGTSRADPRQVPDPVEGVRYLRLDLDDGQSVDDLGERLEQVDVLVNNAGISQFGPLEELSPPELERIFRVNVFGAVRLIQACLPSMRRKGGGTIINVGSLAGRFSPPFYASYAASKAALAGLSDSLRSEVARYGVRVVLIEPNDIHTTIAPEVIIGHGSDYGGDAKRSLEIRNRNMAAAPSPDVVADLVARILESTSPRPRYAVGGSGPLMVFVKRFLPDTVTERLVRRYAGLA